MDLELTDEQRWLSEAVESLLAANQPAPGQAASNGDGPHRVWPNLVEFGALDVGGDDGLGAIELCLLARSLGAHLAATPYLGSAAARFALDTPELRSGNRTVAVAAVEPGAGWRPRTPAARLEVAADGGPRLTGDKRAVEHAGAVDEYLVLASDGDGPALALIAAGAPGTRIHEQPSVDQTIPLGHVEFRDVEVAPDRTLRGDEARAAIERLQCIGSLLAAAEAAGAAGQALAEACRYAGERRQFGHTIGSFQSIRHLLADMHVKQSSCWSTVLYSAASIDDDSPGAARNASIAKAYVSRATQDVAHGAMQVFGGIAFTAEHPAHLYLRRILLRGQQFGDARYHELALGRALAAR